ncbi:PepSY-associated TM helix domain-containing protein [Tistrella mobilis]|uniref:PepSY-associated TM helix domain-containing protein n=1 Tax=Tistrella mobilis TaxID=171437 RepID=UPI0035584EBE
MPPIDRPAGRARTALFSRKGLFRIHAWIGLVLGYLLYVICLSGTLAVFGHELAWLGDPAKRVAAPAAGTPRMSWQGLYDRVAAAHPDLTILGLAMDPDALRRPAWALVAGREGDLRRVPVDPWTGEPGPQKAGLDLHLWLRVFHKQLYVVPGVTGVHGALIVGALALPLLVALITGLITTRRWWQAAVTLRPGRSARLFWSDLHRFAGVWSMLIGILICLTGLWYLVETAADTVGTGFTEGPALPRIAGAQAQAAPPVDLDLAVARATETFPALVVTTIIPPRRPGHPLVLAGRGDGVLLRDGTEGVALDPTTGAVLQIRDAAGLTLLQRWVNTADPLHFGTFGGVATRILWLVAGLLVSAGILAGLIGAWLRLGRRQAGGPPGRVRIGRMRIGALATILPCLGLLLAAIHGSWVYGVVAARPKLLPGEVASIGLAPGEMAILAVILAALAAPLPLWLRLTCRRAAVQSPPSSSPDAGRSRRRLAISAQSSGGG